MSWRDLLRPASFRDAEFHIEAGTRAGGRRVALHEFPKRDEPYAEDMGRRARRHQMTCYLVGPDYLIDRDVLIDALEAEGAGLLIHPTLGEFTVLCEGFNAIERRERGGFVEVDCTFVEAGEIGSLDAPVEATGAKVDDTAYAAQVDSISAMNTDTSIKAGPR